MNATTTSISFRAPGGMAGERKGRREKGRKEEEPDGTHLTLYSRLSRAVRDEDKKGKKLERRKKEEKIKGCAISFSTALSTPLSAAPPK